MNDQDNKWVLITGGAKRIGAKVAKTLHARGMNLAIHYNSSNQDAESLRDELNSIRAESTMVFGANLTSDEAVERLIPDVLSKTGRLDVLINNASTFYPTPIDNITYDDWNSNCSKIVLRRMRNNSRRNNSKIRTRGSKTRL